MEDSKILGKQLIEYCEKGDIEKVKELVSKGVPASFTYIEEGTWGAYDETGALHSAIQYFSKQPKESKSLDLIQFLLEHGANVNSEIGNANWKGSGSRTSAFQMVCNISLEDDDADLLKLFLKYNGDPNKEKRSESHTMRTDGRYISYPIHRAVDSSKPKCLLALLEAGANVNALRTERVNNERGYNQNLSESPINIACSKSTETFIPEENLDEWTENKIDRNIEEEIEKIKKENNQLINKEKLIEELEIKKKLEKIKKLEEINKSKKINWENNCKVIEILLKHNADLNIVSKWNEHEYDETKQQGDDPRDEDYESGITLVKVSKIPLHIAMEKKDKKLLWLLMKYGAKDQDLDYKGSKVNCKSILQDLKDKGCSIEEIQDIEDVYNLKWTPRIHKILPVPLKKAIESIFYCLKKKSKGYKKELAFLVFNDLQSIWDITK